MPYKDISELPSSVKKLPTQAQKYFLQVFNEVYKKNQSDAKSMKIAWSMVKEKFTKKYLNLNDNTDDIQFFTLISKDADSSIILNEEEDYIVMDAVLADTNQTSKGFRLTEEQLNFLADQINTNGSLNPDVSHEVAKKLKSTMMGASEEELASAMKRARGVLKNIKAAVKDGKLWIQAKLNKQYKRHINRFRGLSAEFTGYKKSGGRLEIEKFLGFTFTDKPNFAGALIAR